MASTVVQDTQNSPKMWTYRVQGIPAGLDGEATASLIQSTLKLKDWELCSLAPDPTRVSEQVATFEVSQPPYGVLKPRPKSEWQFPIYKNQWGKTHDSNSNNSAQDLATENTSTSNCRSPNGRTVNRQKKSTITVDKHFHGLTPLNSWDDRRKTIEYGTSSCFQSFQLSITVVSPFPVLADMLLDPSKTKTANICGCAIRFLLTSLNSESLSMAMIRFCRVALVFKTLATLVRRSVTH